MLPAFRVNGFATHCHSEVNSMTCVFSTQYDCNHSIRIPVLDPDGDSVHCRLATGSECESVCDALPGVRLDQVKITPPPPPPPTTEVLHALLGPDSVTRVPAHNHVTDTSVMVTRGLPRAIMHAGITGPIAPIGQISGNRTLASFRAAALGQWALQVGRGVV